MKVKAINDLKYVIDELLKVNKELVDAMKGLKKLSLIYFQIL